MTHDHAETRIEDDALLRGQGRFAGDVNAGGTLHMVFVRSPHAAGDIVDIETDGARTMPGVRAIFTGNDLAEAGFAKFSSTMKHPRPDGLEMIVAPCPILATGHVQFAGDPVACVVAETLTQAMDAAEAVAVEISDRPAVPTVAEALAEEAPIVWPGAPDNLSFRFTKGDAEEVKAAMEAATHRILLELDISRVTASPIEPRGLLAVPGKDGVVTLYTGTQTSHRYAAAIAGVIPGMKPGDVQIPRVDVGGGFGMKNTPAREAVAATWAARELGAPVRWTATRSESFLSDTHGRDRLTTAEMALDEDGTITALGINAFVGLGGYVATNGLVPAVLHYSGLTGVYRIPAAHFSITGVLTNAQPTTPYRGAGRPEATYTIERLMDVAAQRTGIDRVELRRKNMIQRADIPYQTALGFNYDSGDFLTVLEKCLSLADWDGAGRRKQLSCQKNKIRGIGLAMAIEGAGGPYGAAAGEFVHIRLEQRGVLSIMVGSGDSGQGHKTTFRNLAASLTGLDRNRIDVVVNDTTRVEDGFGSSGSRTTQTVGTGIHRACDELITAAKNLLARAFEIEASRISHDDGLFRLVDTNRTLTWSDVADNAKEPLEVKGTYAPDDATFPNGCHICEVEIDPDTGELELLVYNVVEDIGTVLNHQIAEGQLHGGIVQGAGQALMEHIVYDEDGQMLTGSLMDYAMPRASDMPFIQADHQPAPTLTNPLGAKGAGEAGTVGAIPAVISAICDALADYGVEHLEMPATPQKIWRALQSGS